MPFNKRIDEITEADIQALVENQISEGKLVEYKQALSGNSYDDKKEFLADVSSFANASGGHLIYGIREKDGAAIEVCGLQDVNADDEILRFENLLRDNVEPRIPGISMKAIPVAGGAVIILHIPRSWLQPHVVSFQSHWRFYSRNSAGKYPLDVSELRTAFNLSETIADRIRNFRAERIGNIITGETPVSLREGAKVVLHIVSINAFDPASRFDVGSLINSKVDLAPLNTNHWERRHNFDGFLTYEQYPGSPAYSYLQVFRNGIIESVDTNLLSHSQNERYVIPTVTHEKSILEALPRFLDVQKQLGVLPPLFIMLSLLGVNGYTRMVKSAFRRTELPVIDKKDLVISEIMIEDFDCAPDEIMKPAFDAIWNAMGSAHSPNYDSEGKWVGG